MNNWKSGLIQGRTRRRRGKNPELINVSRGKFFRSLHSVSIGASMLPLVSFKSVELGLSGKLKMSADKRIESKVEGVAEEWRKINVELHKLKI